MRKITLAFLAAFSILAVAATGWCEARDREEHSCPRSSSGFAKIQAEAQQGDPVAQTSLATCYELGRNVKPSRPETLRWLSLAAEQKYAPAEYDLGRIYLYGRGIPADYPKALLWETRAADQGHQKAQRDLAYMYERGLGVEPSAVDAAKWNRRAAEQGEVQAQLHLAEALESGSGLRQDRDEARKWYLKAARRDLSEAQLRLAQICTQASDPDYSAAMRWYTKAAENGEAQAMYELGQLYESGVHAPRDAESAFVWFQRGARFGSEKSKARAEALAPALTPKQKQHAASAIESWIVRHSGAQKEEDREEKEER